MAATPTGTPLTPAVLAILLGLAEGDKHGYAIMKDARAPQGGGVQMGPGTLYGTLDRLIRDGLVQESGLSDDERRRYYRLTKTGKRAAMEEARHLEKLLSDARASGLVRKRA